jgi:hypothetical protein
MAAFTDNEIILGNFLENSNANNENNENNIDPKIQIQILNAILQLPAPAMVPFTLNTFIQYILDIRLISLRIHQRELTLPFIVSSLHRVINNNRQIIVPPAAIDATIRAIILEMNIVHIFNSVIFDAVAIALPNYPREVHSLLQSIFLENDINAIEWNEHFLLNTLLNIWNRIPNIIIMEEKITLICNIIYELYKKNIQIRAIIETENTNRFNAAVVNYNLITPNMFPPNTIIPNINPNALLSDYNNWKNRVSQLRPSNIAIQYLDQIKLSISNDKLFI